VLSFNGLDDWTTQEHTRAIAFFKKSLNKKTGRAKEGVDMNKFNAALALLRAVPRPSFAQFARYAAQRAREGRADDHWRPQWLHCHVCDVDYTVPGESINIGIRYRD